jgi:hypothetical protein
VPFIMTDLLICVGLTADDELFVCPHCQDEMIM